MNRVKIDELKNEKQWVCWKYEKRGEKTTKVPKSPLFEGNANCSNPDTWGTFKQCETAQKKYGYSGVGIVITRGLCGIDIDGNRETGAINKEADSILEMFKDAYIEKSPSGTGYHIISYVDASRLPVIKDIEGNTVYSEKGQMTLDGYCLKNDHLGIEIYPSKVTNRFFTFTGEPLDSQVITDNTDSILNFLEKYMKKSVVTVYDKNAKIQEVLEKARKASNGQKFTSLYDRGDLSGYDYDHSRADMALCAMLAFWFKKDKSLIEEVFASSALTSDKWITRDDYRAMTIEKACMNPVIPFEKLLEENTETGNEHRQPLTLAILEAWLEEKNISIKKNELTHEMIITGIDDSFDKETLVNDLCVIIHDEIKAHWSCSVTQVNGMLAIIAGKNRYNPIKHMLAKAPEWDGKDRINELFEVMKIPKEDSLSRKLIHKWLLMAIALAQNNIENAFGSDGILVLQGSQGIGKTALCSKLGIDSQFCKTGLYIDTKDKDTIIRATSCWIGELGEIGCTMKSDIDRLKSFITESIDRYRVPYGRTDIKAVRHSCFIATTNDTRFLIDTTGSRRFWTVECPEKFDLEGLNKLNILQLWKQVENELMKYEYSTDFGSPFQQSFRLNEYEQNQLAERNSAYEKLLKGQAEVQDILSMANDNPDSYCWSNVTVSEFKKYYRTLDKYSSEQIGIALTQEKVEIKHARENGKPQKVRYLPIPTDGESKGSCVF